MTDGLKAIGSMMTRPNATFATIRDNAHHYRWWAAGIFGLVSVLTATVSWANPLLFREGVVPEIAWTLIYVVMGGLASAFVIWAVGKSHGGNPDRNKVVTVIFYTHIPTIIGYSLTALIMPVLDSGTIANFMLALPYRAVTGVEGQPGLAPLPIAETVAAYIAAFAILLGTGIWAAILLVKAIRVVHGCGVIQAMGIGLAGTASAVAIHILFGWFLMPSIRWSMTLG